MKEVKIIQDDSGAVSIEMTGPDGKPQVMPAESVEDAIEQAKVIMGGGEGADLESESDGEMPEEAPMLEDPANGVQVASKGKKLEDKMPMLEEDKKGMMPKKKPGWGDYGM